VHPQKKNPGYAYHVRMHAIGPTTTYYLRRPPRTHDAPAC